MPDPLDALVEVLKQGIVRALPTSGSCGGWGWSAGAFTSDSNPLTPSSPGFDSWDSTVDHAYRAHDLRRMDEVDWMDIHINDVQLVADLFNADYSDVGLYDTLYAGVAIGYFTAISPITLAGAKLGDAIDYGQNQLSDLDQSLQSGLSSFGSILGEFFEGGEDSEMYNISDLHLDYWEGPNVVSEDDSEREFFDLNEFTVDFRDGWHPDWDEYAPVVLDLDNDGLELIGFDESAIFFDTDDDGFLESTGWVGADDGFLAIDLNDNDLVDLAGELSFALQTGADDTDLEALATLYDTNNDDILDSSDTDFLKFHVWQDLDQDGETDSGELKTLAQAGIESIDLTSTTVDEIYSGNILHGTTTYTRTDQTTGTVGDVGLLSSTIGFSLSEDSVRTLVETESDGNIYVAKDGEQVLADSAALGAVSVVGAAMADKIYTSDISNVAFDGGAGNDTLTGGSGNDWLVGGSGSDTLSGGAGQDILLIDSEDLQADVDGGDGFDIALVADSAGVSLNLTTANLEAAYGGDGSDSFTYSGSGSVVLSGGAGGDTLTGGSGADKLSGDAGADKLTGGAGDDWLFIDSEDVQASIDAGAGVDWVVVSTATGVAFDLGAANAEYAYGNDGADTFNTTGSGAIRVHGGGGDDTITGGSGADVLVGGAGSDALDGAAGGDYLSYVGSLAGVTIDIGADTASGGDAEGDTIDNFEGVIGSSFADTLTGSSGNDNFYGEYGDDTLKGAAGSDYLDGGVGSDTASYAGSAAVTIDLGVGTNSGGDAAGDTLVGIENLVGSANADTLTGDANANVIEGGASGDTLDGGAGSDTLSYAGSSAGITIDLSADTASGGDAVSDTISNFENVTGSAFGDTLTGDGTANLIDAGAGADTVVAGGGADPVLGGDGVDDLDGGADDDVIEGGASGDTLDGGTGTDTLSYAGSDAAVTVDLSTNTVSGGHAASDTVTGFESVTGSAYADTLTGDSGANVIEGGAEGDTIDGGTGSDTASYAGAGSGVTVDLTDGGGDLYADLPTTFDSNRKDGTVTLSGGDATATHGGAGASVIYGSGAGNTDGWMVQTVQFDPGSLTGTSFEARVLLSAVHTVGAGAGCTHGDIRATV